MKYKNLSESLKIGNLAVATDSIPLAGQFLVKKLSYLKRKSVSTKVLVPFSLEREHLWEIAELCFQSRPVRFLPIRMSRAIQISLAFFVKAK